LSAGAQRRGFRAPGGECSEPTWRAGAERPRGATMKLAAAIAICCVPSLVLAEESEVTFVNVPAPNAESIVIDQPQGKLTLQGWDKPEVRVVAHKHAPDAQMLDQLRVDFEMSPDGRIHIRTGVRLKNGNFLSLPASDGAGIDLTITAPRQVSLKAQTWAGDIDAAGFRSGAQLSSRGGEVHAYDIEGEVRTAALRGKQRLTSIHGNVEADGVTGDVELDTIDGDVLEAKVVDGQIIARRIRSALARLFSSKGGVVFMGSTRPGARYEITTREGDVKLSLEHAPFSVSARAPAGAVKNGFTLSHAVGSPTTLQGEYLGGGPQLELTAAHGNVILEPAAAQR
jgi:hypothetical protein